MQIKRTCKVTISLLTFATFDRCGALVSSICSLIVNHAQLAQLNITVVVRNNNPDLASEEFEKLWQGLILKYPSLDFLLFNDGPNIGFGNGHNSNFDALPCDYFLVLNDDIEFQNVDWLETALTILEQDTAVAAIGAAGNAGSITPFYGNGAPDRQWHHWPLRYIEGSVMLLRAGVFAEVGKFDPAYEWVFCEDSDLSFRIRALGYRLEWID